MERPILEIRESNERGHAEHGWLDSDHTFSFAGYHEPKYMSFDTHSLQDMEILSDVFEGALEHKNSMGSGSVIHPGELQFMRAGTGVTHSEYNHARTGQVHFLQIRVIPDTECLEPAYNQREFSPEERRGKHRLVA